MLIALKNYLKQIFSFKYILVFFFPSPKFMTSFLATVSGVHLEGLIMAHGSKWAQCTEKNMKAMSVGSAA